MKFKTMINTGLIAGLTIGLIGCGTYSHDMHDHHHHHHHGHQHHSKAENQENVAVANQGEQDETAMRESTPAQTEEIAQADAREEREERTEIREAKEVKEAAKLVSHTYNFDYDSAKLTRETKSELEKYVDYLASHPNTHVRIEGHADERGTTAYNLGLSKKRASAVANYLLDRGVAKNQIEVMSFGAQKPLASGNSEEAYAKNRRAEVQFEMNQDSAA